MKVTPLDLRQTRFQTVMRGYDRGEVTAFLSEAAEDYENALRENERLRQELSKVEAVLGEHRGQEKNLSNTLLTAQKLADNISNRSIDEMYELALSAGATGGKIAGAGGGGFLLLYVPRHRQDAVRNALRTFREFPWLIEHDGSKAIFNLRRYSVR